jgi:inorganic triphosphatase YgiF
MEIIEREYKWHAQDKDDFKKVLRVLRALPFKRARRKEFITDEYFDDEEGSFRADKTALRLRKINRKFEITLKGKSAISKGFAARSEETIRLRVSGDREARARFCVFFAKIRAGGHPLKIFTIKNKRRVIELKAAGFNAQASFDDCDIITPSKTVKLYEIELELKKGSASVLSRVAEQISRGTGLAYAKISKVATATSNL